MDEEKLVKLLEKKFVTKNEFSEFRGENHKSFYDVSIQLRDIKTELKEIKEDINELKPSAKSLDKILEQYPIERINRLERHSKLSPFVPAVSVE